MRSLLVFDKERLDRIEAAIAAFDAQPATDRERKMHLLRSLENEKHELTRGNPALRLIRRPRPAA